jgi:sugar lactone lactonase YvrE
MYMPEIVAADKKGNVYVAVQNTLGNYVIRRIDASTGVITTFAGGGWETATVAGIKATSAYIKPSGIAIDSVGNVFFSDVGTIQKIDVSTGLLTMVAGNKGSNGSTADNIPATDAFLGSTAAVALDKAGNMFIADIDSRRVRKVSVSTGIITTVAGSGNWGYSGDDGPATSAEMRRPVGIAIDNKENLYIIDIDNSRIRKVDAATGIMTTIAGNGTFGFSGDGGPATAAALYHPTSIAVDGKGNVYLADGYDIHRIRKIDAATGIISTVAGNGMGGYAGDGGLAIAASLNTPLGIAVSEAGDMYIGDVDNHRVRKVAAATGIITTIAGKGRLPFIGEGIPGTLATLNHPLGLTVDQNRNIYFADHENFCVRRIDE